MDSNEMTELEFDELFDLTATEVNDGAVPFGIIGEGVGTTCLSCVTVKSCNS